MSLIGLDTIRIDGGTQPRDHIAEDVVRRYAEDMAEGAAFPPVAVFYDGTDHWLADGFHRVAAARALGLAEIEAEVHQGTRRDAILYSVGANATHGYPRSNADKRRAVLTLLRDPEWSQWPNREIARKCAVSLDLVNRVRHDLSLNETFSKAPPPPNVPPKVVEKAGAIRAAGGEPRYYRNKYGEVGVMDTANIGRRPVADRPVFDSAPMAAADPLAIPPELDRRKPPFPPEHAPIAGRIAYLLQELANSLTITPAEMAAACTWSRSELAGHMSRIAPWIEDLMERMRDDAA